MSTLTPYKQFEGIAFALESAADSTSSLPPYDSPIDATNSFVADVQDRMEQRFFRNERDYTLINDGISVMAHLVISAAKVFRGTSSTDFLYAFSDERTADNTTKLIARGRDGLARDIERLYGLGSDHSKRAPLFDLIHIEYDGDFFSLQPKHHELLQRLPASKSCPFTQFMRETTVAFAYKLHDLGIIEPILNKENTVV